MHAGELLSWRDEGWTAFIGFELKAQLTTCRVGVDSGAFLLRPLWERGIADDLKMPLNGVLHP
jgi:hypothetical protein